MLDALRATDVLSLEEIRSDGLDLLATRAGHMKEPRDYTAKMDSVRFGRVLGIGTRLAGRTLVEAVDAATSPDPSTKGSARGAGRGAGDDTRRDVPRDGVILSAKETGARTVQQARATSHGVRRGGRRFGEAVWGPVARASGVLWLEVTGVFFGLIALLGVDGMWINRRTMHWRETGYEMHEHFLIGAGVALVFGYFAVSSFVRAARGSRLSQ